MGSNRFGQLGLKEPQFYQEPVVILEGHNVASLHCGAEHSFFISGTHGRRQTSTRSTAWVST
jgi:alpha-tubulin suppressor-like RCC1 family protein